MIIEMSGIQTDRLYRSPNSVLSDRENCSTHNERVMSTLSDNCSLPGGKELSIQYYNLLNECKDTSERKEYDLDNEMDTSKLSDFNVRSLNDDSGSHTIDILSASLLSPNNDSKTFRQYSNDGFQSDVVGDYLGKFVAQYEKSPWLWVDSESSPLKLSDIQHPLITPESIKRQRSNYIHMANNTSKLHFAMNSKNVPKLGHSLKSSSQFNKMQNHDEFVDMTPLHSQNNTVNSLYPNQLNSHLDKHNNYNFYQPNDLSSNPKYSLSTNRTNLINLSNNPSLSQCVSLSLTSDDELNTTMLKPSDISEKPKLHEMKLNHDMRPSMNSSPINLLIKDSDKVSRFSCGESLTYSHTDRMSLVSNYNTSNSQYLLHTPNDCDTYLADSNQSSYIKNTEDTLTSRNPSTSHESNNYDNSLRKPVAPREYYTNSNTPSYRNTNNETPLHVNEYTSDLLYLGNDSVHTPVPKYNDSFKVENVTPGPGYYQFESQSSKSVQPHRHYYLNNKVCIDPTTSSTKAKSKYLSPALSSVSRPTLSSEIKKWRKLKSSHNLDEYSNTFDDNSSFDTILRSFHQSRSRSSGLSKTLDTERYQTDILSVENEQTNPDDTTSSHTVSRMTPSSGEYTAIPYQTLSGASSSITPTDYQKLMNKRYTPKSNKYSSLGNYTLYNDSELNRNDLPAKSDKTPLYSSKHHVDGRNSVVDGFHKKSNDHSIINTPSHIMKNNLQKYPSRFRIKQEASEVQLKSGESSDMYTYSSYSLQANHLNNNHNCIQTVYAKTASPSEECHLHSNKSSIFLRSISMPTRQSDLSCPTLNSSRSLDMTDENKDSYIYHPIHNSKRSTSHDILLDPYVKSKKNNEFSDDYTSSSNKGSSFPYTNEYQYPNQNKFDNQHQRQYAHNGNQNSPSVLRFTENDLNLSDITPYPVKEKVLVASNPSNAYQWTSNQLNNTSHDYDMTLNGIQQDVLNENIVNPPKTSKPNTSTQFDLKNTRNYTRVAPKEEYNDHVNETMESSKHDEASGEITHHSSVYQYKRRPYSRRFIQRLLTKKKTPNKYQNLKHTHIAKHIESSSNTSRVHYDNKESSSFQLKSFEESDQLVNSWIQLNYKLKQQGISPNGIPLLNHHLAHIYEKRVFVYHQKHKDNNKKSKNNKKNLSNSFIDNSYNIELLLANIDVFQIIKLWNTTLDELIRFKTYYSQLHEYEGNYLQIFKKNDDLKKENVDLKDKIESLERSLCQLEGSYSKKWNMEINYHELIIKQERITKQLQIERDKYRIILIQKRQLDLILANLKQQLARLIQKQDRIRCKAQDVLRHFVKTGMIDLSVLDNPKKFVKQLKINKKLNDEKNKALDKNAFIKKDNLSKHSRIVSKLLVNEGLFELIWFYESQIYSLSHESDVVKNMKSTQQLKGDIQTSSVSDELYTDPQITKLTNQVNNANCTEELPLNVTGTTMATTGVGTWASKTLSKADLLKKTNEKMNEVMPVPDVVKHSTHESSDSHWYVEDVQRKWKLTIEEKIRNEIKYQDEIKKLKILLSEYEDKSLPKNKDVILDKNSYSYGESMRPHEEDYSNDVNTMDKNDMDLNSVVNDKSELENLCDSFLKGRSEKLESRLLIRRDRRLYRAGLQQNIENLEKRGQLSHIINQCCRVLDFHEPDRLPYLLERSALCLMQAKAMKQFVDNIALYTGISSYFNDTKKHYMEMEHIIIKWREIFLNLDDFLFLRRCVVGILDIFNSSLMKESFNIGFNWIHKIQLEIVNSLGRLHPNEATEKQLGTTLKSITSLLVQARDSYIQLYHEVPNSTPVKPTTISHNSEYHCVSTKDGDKIIKHFMSIFQVSNVDLCIAAMDRLYLKIKEHIRFYRGIITVLNLPLETHPSEVLKHIALLEDGAHRYTHRFENESETNSISIHSSVLDSQDIKDLLVVLHEIQIRLNLPRPPSTSITDKLFRTRKESLKNVNITSIPEQDIDQFMGLLDSMSVQHQNIDSCSISCSSLMVSSNSNSIVINTASNMNYDTLNGLQEDRYQWKMWARRCIFTVDLFARIVEQAKWALIEKK